MKILYVITKSNWGGAQKHVFDLASLLKEKGHTTVVALGGDGILRKRLEDAGIKTYPIAPLNRDIAVSKEMASFKEIYSVIKREKPDVLHLHSPKAAGLGAIAGRFLRVPKIIYTVHGWAFNEPRPIWQRMSIRLASWFTMLCTNRVVLLSEIEYRQAERFPAVKHKLILIRQGLKAPTFMSIDGTKQALAKHLGLNFNEYTKKFVIGTIAELHPNKGLSYLLEAYKVALESRPEAIGVIIGDGDLLAELNMSIKEKGLEGRVFLAGYMENAAEYLKAFNLFVLPSVKEGLPYVILEAGHASLPVIATTVGGIPEAVEDMKSGVLVQPHDSSELAHAISYIIEHPVLAKQYGVALKESVTTKYGLERMVNETENLYKA